MTTTEQQVIDVLTVAEGVPVPTMDIVAQIAGAYEPVDIARITWAVYHLASQGRIVQAPDPDGRGAAYWVLG